MPKRSDSILIQDISNSILEVQLFTQGIYKSFSEDRKTILAVLQSSTIIGEATNALSAEFTLQYNGYHWRNVIGFRNRIVHDFAGVDDNLVWEVITTHLTEMLNYLTEIQKK